MKINLPFDMKSQAGFLFPTEIKPSSMVGAGMGRYTKVFIRSGWVVRGDPIVSVDYFLKKLGGVNPGYTVAIHLANEDDINALEKAWESADMDKVRELMSWYMANVPLERTDMDIKTGLGYILSHSFITNHAGKATGARNIQTYVENGMLYHKAVRDIEPGEELFLDYFDMEIPSYLRKWCKDKELTDVGTMAENIVG